MTNWNGYQLTLAPDGTEFEIQSPFASGMISTETPAAPAPAPSAPPTGELWVPGAERIVNRRSAGGSYLPSPWRFVFHCTDEAVPSPDEFRAVAAKHANPPHLWAMPTANLLLQTISLHRSAFALARPHATQTNRLHTIQIELAGRAKDMATVSPDYLNWIAERVLAPVARMVPINLDRVVMPALTKDNCYGDKTACRMSPAMWASFDGVTGHFAVPENVHWDTGQLPLDKIAARAYQLVHPMPIGPYQTAPTQFAAGDELEQERRNPPHEGPEYGDNQEFEDGYERDVPAFAEGLAEQQEVNAYLAAESPAGTSGGCGFPSGAKLIVVSGGTGPGEEHYDPTGFNDPLYDTSASQRAIALSANFTVADLAQSGKVYADRARISCALVTGLQRIRDRVGKPVTISSGYRSYKANLALYAARGKPATTSQHSSGRAADISIAGMTGLDIAKLAILLCGPNIGIGVAGNWAHLDFRGTWARWTYFAEPDNSRIIAELDAHRQGVLTGAIR